MSGELLVSRATAFLWRLVEAAGTDPKRGAGKELEVILEEMGLGPERQAVDGEFANIIVSLGEQPTVLITAHYDTVPEEIEGQRAERRLTAGRLYGRGSCDALGSIAALLAALDCLQREGFPLRKCRALLAFTADEEEEGRGSLRLAESLPQSVKSALVLEPTRLAFALVELGTLEYHLKIKGVTAHGSVPESGHNPLEVLLQLMEETAGLVKELNRQFTPSTPLVVVPLLVRGGSEALAVPAEAELKIDFRVPLEIPLSLLRGRFQELLGRHAGLKYEVLEEAPPFAVEKDDPLVRLLAALYEKATGEKPQFSVMPSWTDAHNLHARGITTVIWGPGDLGIAHTEREHLELKELCRSAEFLAALLRYLGEI